jgi:pectate lyase
MIKILALLLLLPTLAWAGPEMLLMLTNGMGTVSGGGISDTFGADTSGNYTSIAGTLSVSGDAAHGTIGQVTLSSHNTPVGSADQTVQGDVTYDSTTGDSGMILARFDRSGGGTFYAARIVGDNLRLYSYAGSTGTQIAVNGSDTLTSGTYTLKIVISGTSITVYRGGVSKITVTDSTYASGNYCGMGFRDTGSFDATVDNFTCTTP